MSDGLLKMDLVRFVGSTPGMPPEVAEDARRAMARYPGGVLLPVVFMVSERVDGRWKPHNPGAASATPQGARDSLAGWLRVMGPFTLKLSPAEREAYARAADELDDKPRDGLSVAGRRFRITRVERLVRVGPDGPEGPRPSDFDPEPPVEVHARQLKARGLWKDEDEDGPIELDDRALELKALWEQEEARWAAAKERRANRRRRGDAS